VPKCLTEKKKSAGMRNPGTREASTGNAQAEAETQRMMKTAPIRNGISSSVAVSSPEPHVDARLAIVETDSIATAGERRDTMLDRDAGLISRAAELVAAKFWNENCMVESDADMVERRAEQRRTEAIQATQPHILAIFASFQMLWLVLM